MCLIISVRQRRRDFYKNILGKALVYSLSFYTLLLLRLNFVSPPSYLHWSTAKITATRAESRLLLYVRSVRLVRTLGVFTATCGSLAVKLHSDIAQNYDEKNVL